MRLRTQDLIHFIPRLRRYARVLTRHAQDAEDLVQESLLRAHERPPELRNKGSAGVWLTSVLHNTFVDHMRSRAASARRERDFADLLPRHLDAPQETSVRLAQLLEAFLDLPVEQREVLHLVAIEGHSYAEAAAVLGIPQGTLMSRLGRARTSLRNLEEQGPKLRIVRSRHDR